MTETTSTAPEADAQPQEERPSPPLPDTPVAESGAELGEDPQEFAQAVADADFRQRVDALIMAAGEVVNGLDRTTSMRILGSAMGAIACQVTPGQPINRISILAMLHGFAANAVLVYGPAVDAAWVAQQQAAQAAAEEAAG